MSDLNYKSMKAKEPLKNYTICVKESDGIRNMCKKDDCMNSLVFISQISSNWSRYENLPIKEGEEVRYVDIIIQPKPEIY